MSTLYLDAFDRIRKEIFLKLSNFSDEFILADGTAIMLLSNFRKSFDFDCFSENPLRRILLAKARSVFGNDIVVQVDNTNLLLFTTINNVKIDFVYFPYSPIHNILNTEPIPIFDLRDLASNKTYTIGRKAAWRDYVDMFFLEKKFGLDSIINEVMMKYKGEFSEKLF